MRIDSGLATPAAATGEADPKLVDGARQFEAMMLEQMLKPLSFGGSPDDPGGESEGGAAGTIRGFGTEAVAKAVAIGGGFGLARQIVRQVTAEHESAQQRTGGTKVS